MVGFRFSGLVVRIPPLFILVYAVQREMFVEHCGAAVFVTMVAAGPFALI